MSKRILSVRLYREVDTDPDLSHIGNYSRHPENDFAIDREERGERENGSYRYFNPGTTEAFDAKASWIPKRVKHKRAYWLKSMKKNAEADYKRMEDYNRGLWCMAGVRAEATVNLTGNSTQRIGSMGLWGIETDSEESYFEEIEQEELDGLRNELEAIGFTTKQIDEAFTKVEKLKD